VRPEVCFDASMLAEAFRMAAENPINRNRGSCIQQEVGAMGEIAFAACFTNDWRQHQILKNVGMPDFDGNIEVKASGFPFLENLNLKVRDEYAIREVKRLREDGFTGSDLIYVQIIIDTSARIPEEIKAGTRAVICGWADHAHVMATPPKAERNRHGGLLGYDSRSIPISQLRAMEEFPIPRRA